MVSLIPTLSASPTLGPLATATPTSVATSLRTVTGSNPPEIVSAVCVPQPLSVSRPGGLAVKLRGYAQRFKVDVFTPAYIKAAVINIEAPAGPGWNILPVECHAWPRGLLFLRVTVEGNGGSSAVLVKTYLLP